MKILKSRNIDCYPKHTSADTQYYELDSKDEAWIYSWLYRLLGDMNEECTADPDLQRDWFKRRPGLYPKGRNGPNSHASILGGICSAKIKNPNKNLSEPQLAAVEHLFTFISQYYRDEPDAPESIRFVKKIYSIQS